MKRAIWSLALYENEMLDLPGEYKPVSSRALFRNLIGDKSFGAALFVGVLCWLFEPRAEKAEDRQIPFIPWREQAEAIQDMDACIDAGEDFAMTKDRDQGATWIAAEVGGCYRFITDDGYTALFGSRVDFMVDSPDPDSIFWKFDKQMDMIPSWLMPQGYDPQSKTCKQQNYRFNPANGATITGQAPTKNFAVGGRKKFICFDEFPEWEEGKTAWQNAGASTECRGWIGTPAVTKNHAWEIREGAGDFVNTRVKKIRLSWKNDPRKNKMTLDPVTGKPVNNWLIRTLGDPKNGIPGRYSKEAFDRQFGDKWDTSAGLTIYSHYLGQTALVYAEYDPGWPLYTVLDPGIGDETAIIWIQWRPDRGKYVALHTYRRAGFDVNYFIPILLGRKNPHEVLDFESQYDEPAWDTIRRMESWQRWDAEKGRRTPAYAGHYGDPFGANRSWGSSKSGYDVLADAGIDLIYSRERDKITFNSRIETTRRLLPFLEIDEKWARSLHTALSLYGRHKDTNVPIHDEHSHLCTALEFFFVNFDMTDELEQIAKSKRIVQPARSMASPHSAGVPFQNEERLAQLLAAAGSGQRGYTGPLYG